LMRASTVQKILRAIVLAHNPTPPGSKADLKARLYA